MTALQHELLGRGYHFYCGGVWDSKLTFAREPWHGLWTSCSVCASIGFRLIRLTSANKEAITTEGRDVSEN